MKIVYMLRFCSGIILRFNSFAELRKLIREYKNYGYDFTFHKSFFAEGKIHRMYIQK